MRIGRKIHLLSLVLALCAARNAAPASAQQIVLTEPPAPLLPATLGKLARITQGDSGDGLGQLDAAGLTPQDKAVLTEDGLKRFAKSDYVQGTEHGTVSVYQFRDASGAISAFDYLRRPGPLGAAKMGDETAPGPANDIVFRSGLNVVRESFNLHGEHVGLLMDDLISHLPKALGTNGIPPLLPTLLPQKNLDADSVKYALGPAGYAAMNGVLPADSMGFDKSGETVTAKYRGGGMLTLALYPTPAIAGMHERAAQSALQQASIRREGPLVIIATGAWPAGAAQKLIDGIHLRVDASFDKPMPLEFHTEIRKTYSLFESIAIFCGLGAVASVVLALFFGGGRALIRVMQGKPAATEPEFLHIDLRGRPHRIRTGNGPDA